MDYNYIKMGLNFIFDQTKNDQFTLSFPETILKIEANQKINDLYL
jgi:hypothetical protein